MQQEPRLLACYSGDENMINAYNEGKDLYATIASSVYNNTYWDNMEKHQDGTPNPAGKKRRSSVKSLLLGIMYGRGVASIAEQTGASYEEAQKIIDDFYKGFPKVKTWTTQTQAFCKETGYVEDLWGRRRRLPDILLPKYSVKLTKGTASLEGNPILHTLGKVTKEENPSVLKYRKQLENIRSRKEYETIKNNAAKDGITIVDNGGFIAQAERQCVNARIQGGAATMSKRAMIKVHADKELRKLGFQLLLAVHDELIGECPEENSEAVAERLCEIMKHAAEPECQVRFKCDPTIEPCWYWNDYQDAMIEKFQMKLAEGESPSDIFNEFKETYSEMTESRLQTLLSEVL